ncbi:hypothetical protein V3W47_06890 [Deinococcus sp. YIM 134068]|uniref:hypothetical protein n=1 Tax=Deinococcus lichenicola TaxID=3118910 RepID=UPI002F92BFC2
MGEYPRIASRQENGGAVFQAIAFGYVVAQYPHLDVIADKVRTGSARQRRFGDVDGYMGLDLELSVEVKDLEITTANLGRQLGSFVEALEGLETIATAFVRAITDDACADLEGRGIRVLTQDQLLREVAGWDWHKQNRAVLGLLHQLAHVEQTTHGVQRLLSFIAQHDDQYDALAYSTPDADEATGVSPQPEGGWAAPRQEAPGSPLPAQQPEPE